MPYKSLAWWVSRVNQTASLRGSPPHWQVGPRLQIPTASFWFSQTTLRFENLLVRLTDHRETYPHSYVYYRKRIQIRSSWRKRHIGQSLRKHQTWSFRSPFPCGVTDCYLLPTITCDTTHGGSPTWETHLSCGAPSFYWGFITSTWLSHCPLGWTLSPVSPPLQRSEW